jgi:hypothetical protein
MNIAISLKLDYKTLEKINLTVLNWSNLEMK